MQTKSKYHQTQKQLNEERDCIEASKLDINHFEFLYNKYHESVFRFVYQRLNDKDSAFDITSQVFLSAMTNLKKYKFKGIPFSSWLFRIAYNELMDVFSKRKAQRTINIDDIHLYDIINEIEVEKVEKYQNRLMNAITQLSEKELPLIEMRFFEKKSFRVIADILCITENNAKVRTYRVIDKLKKSFFN